MLSVVRDTNEPAEVRLAAMDTLATAAFSVVAFEPCRNDYIAALREVSQDPDPKIRESALGAARRREGRVRAKETGRRAEETRRRRWCRPRRRYNSSVTTFTRNRIAVARDIVKNPPSDVAKREALRLLVADATSAPLFEKAAARQERDA